MFIFSLAFGMNKELSRKESLEYFGAFLFISLRSDLLGMREADWEGEIASYLSKRGFPSLKTEL